MTCRWVSRTEPRTLPGHHLADCDGAPCRGCQPCPERHCAICGREHVTVDGRGTDGTCGTCLADTRTNLHQIETYSRSLPAEALHRGVHSDAAAYAGPTITTPDGIEAWRNRVLSAMWGRIPPVEEDDRHPEWVLGTWEMLVREHLNQPSRARIQLGAARAYLDQHLTRLAHDPEFPIEELARDLRHCVAMLEELLHAGEQIEEGAPCLDCSQPVTRHTDDTGRVTYTCDRCRIELTENQYRLTVQAAHVYYADRLCVVDLAQRLDAPESTIRRWASTVTIQRRGEEPREIPPLLRSCGRDTRARKVYRVADAQAILSAGGDHRRSGTVSNDGAENSALTKTA